MRPSAIGGAPVVSRGEPPATLGNADSAVTLPWVIGCAICAAAAVRMLAMDPSLCERVDYSGQSISTQDMPADTIQVVPAPVPAKRPIIVPGGATIAPSTGSKEPLEPFAAIAPAKV